MNPAKQDVIDQHAKGIVRDHILCDVTGLVSELVESENEVGLVLMHGDPESSTRAYAAHEVWAVTDWLATKLRMREHRVEKVGGWNYWARGGSGQSLYHDDVIQRIALSICPCNQLE